MEDLEGSMRQTALKSHFKKLTTFDCFFDLPIELQDQILSCLCCFPQGVMVDDSRPPHTPGSLRYSSSSSAQLVADREEEEHSDSYTPIGRTNNPSSASPSSSTLPLEQQPRYRPAPPPLSLMLSCSELYHRARQIYYARNTFYLDFRTLQPRKACQVVGYDRAGRVVRKKGRSRVDAFLLATGDDNRNTFNSHCAAASVNLNGAAGESSHHTRMVIRSLVVYFRRFGGHQLEKELIPALSDMVLRGGLRRLRVDVMGEYVRDIQRVYPGVVGDWNATRLKRVDLSNNVALRQLLVLLTDPYMQEAKMRVFRATHGWFWCQFHEKGTRETETDEEEGRSGCALNRSPLQLHAPTTTTTSTAAAAERPPSKTSKTDDDDDWMEVDIARLVQACGRDSAEYRIKSVSSGDGY